MRGYGDVFLKPRFEQNPTIGHSYLIELKYAHAGASSKEIQTLKKEADTQLKRYPTSPYLKEKTGETKFHAITVIFKGFEMVVCEEVPQEDDLS